MLANNDPLKGYYDKIVVDPEKVKIIRGMHIMFGFCFDGNNFGVDKLKRRWVEEGYCTEETANKIFPETNAELEMRVKGV